MRPSVKTGRLYTLYAENNWTISQTISQTIGQNPHSGHFSPKPNAKIGLFLAVFIYEWRVFLGT
jgi:hypothetical protein